jgi:long-chain acyl-CoA synthetase
VPNDQFPWLKNYEQRVSANLSYPEISLSEMLENTTANYPDNLALVFNGENIPYSRLLDLVNRLATALHALGVKKGDRVAIMLPNCPQWVIGYFAVLKLGAIVVQTNPLYVERELEYQFNDSGTETIIVLDSLLGRIINIKEHTALKRVISVSLTEQATNETSLSFASLLQEYPPNPPAVSIDPKEDVAIFQYTGGTTGTSKGVILTHYNLIVNVLQTRTWLPVKQGEERFLSVLPLFHVYSMTLNNNLAVFLGGSQYLLPKFDLYTTLKVINDYKPTMFFGAPSIYIAIINHPAVADYDLKSINYCVSGSATLPVEVAQKFGEMTGGTLVEGYGLSEASPVTHINPFDGNARIGSIGLPLSDTIAKIVDLETGTIELPPNEAGELIIKGPQVMKGYWNMPDETSMTLREEWLFTGDIAKMDEDGFFYIVDRKKDVIISCGLKTYPKEVEEVLFEHPKVMEAAVIGIPDPSKGEVVKAFVVLQSGQTATQKELIAYCRQKLAPFKVPRLVEFCEFLPKSNVGKVLRKALREKA